jgi:hypothetical protein
MYFYPVQMGVTIYYRGVLKTPELIQDLIAEVTDIAKTNKWATHILDNPWDQDISLYMSDDDDDPRFEGNAGLKGVLVDLHPDIDGLPLLFDRTGTCRSFEEMAEPEENRPAISHVSTQTAGIDTHIQLLGFLEYIGNTYMREWHIDDDSGYFLHQDKEKAQHVFDAVNDAIAAVTEAFNTIEMPEDIRGKEEEFLSLIENRIRTFLPDAEIHRIDEEE